MDEGGGGVGAEGELLRVHAVVTVPDQVDVLVDDLMDTSSHCGTTQTCTPTRRPVLPPSQAEQMLASRQYCITASLRRLVKTDLVGHLVSRPMLLPARLYVINQATRSQEQQQYHGICVTKLTPPRATTRSTTLQRWQSCGSLHAQPTYDGKEDSKETGKE